MIFDSLINAFVNVVTGLLDMLPTVNIFDNASVSGLLPVLNTAACVVPVGTMAIGITIWLVLANFDLIHAVISWVLRKIPTME